MKLNSYILAGLILLLIFGGIALSTAMNWWQTESTKVPVTFTDGEFAGQYDPADIRGSYTFGEISDLFNIPLKDLTAAFGLPAGKDQAAFAVKDLETLYADLPVEIGTSSVRMFVAFYNGLPYDLTTADDTYLFAAAADILTAHEKMTSDQAAFLAAHTLDLGGAATATDAAQAETAATEHVAVDGTVTGATTFQDLLDWGVSQVEIEQIIGAAMPDPATVVKDFVTQNGQTFSEVKTALQAAVDAVAK
jgi:hypothetical protein